MSHRRKTQKRRLYGRGKTLYNIHFPALSHPLSKSNTPNINKSTLRINAPEFIPSNQKAVAIDCEMVGIGNPDNKGRYKTSLAQVAIVDFNGNIKLEDYVIPKEGLNKVSEYFTHISGITENKLKGLNSKTHSFDIIKEKVKEILDEKIIVGHQLDSDFKVLEYVPTDPSKVWDTAVINEYMKNTFRGRGPRKLKNITKEFVGNNIQVEEKPHSPVEDAMSSMNLYRVSLGFPKLPIPFH